jgi:hypothetical protein
LVLEDFSGEDRLRKEDSRTTSETIRIIHAQQAASDTALIIQTTVRSIIVLAIVATGSYCLITGKQIPAEAWQIAIVVVGSLFGVDIITRVKTHLNNK